MRRDDDTDGAIPFPTSPVSNGEWLPAPITERQRLAARLIAEECATRARQHGMTRGQFLRTAAATATAFAVLNKVYGLPGSGDAAAMPMRKEHCDDLDAAREVLDRTYLVMDVQQHHVDLTRFPGAALCFLRFRDRDAAGGCPANVGQLNFVKEIFVDSETDVGVISGLPFGGVPLGPVAMAETRDLVNQLAGSERCLAQVVCDPTFDSGGATSSGSSWRRSRASPGRSARRVYAEIGSSFAIAFSAGPETAAHFMGQLLKALGSKNILWGTDSIWWGSPQWLIDAFKTLEIPPAMQERFGYPPLNAKAKRRILGLNAARLYGIKPKAERCTVPLDRLQQLQAELGGPRATRRLAVYGARTRREFLRIFGNATV